MKSVQMVTKESKWLTKETNVKHVVDHIIPLYGRDPQTNIHNVCGLHVENNLQVLTKEQNSVKSNFYIVE